MSKEYINRYARYGQKEEIERLVIGKRIDNVDKLSVKELYGVPCLCNKEEEK